MDKNISVIAHELQTIINDSVSSILNEKVKEVLNDVIACYDNNIVKIESCDDVELSINTGSKIIGISCPTLSTWIKYNKFPQQDNGKVLLSNCLKERQHHKIKVLQRRNIIPITPKTTRSKPFDFDKRA